MVNEARRIKAPKVEMEERYSALITYAEAALDTRSSSDLGPTLDANAVEQIGQMTANGWEPATAAEAWQTWVGLVAEAAADLAVSEGSWRAE